jgi:digeranylgeranylglycerophospholipid reductase
METDVIIIGAGPAGLSAAEAVAKHNVDVIVLEKSSEIGYPIHTSGGSWIKDLIDLGISDSLFHPIKRCRFMSPNKEANFVFNEPSACVLDVRGLYQSMAEKAAQAGAKIRVNTRVVEPIIEGRYVKGVKATNINGDLKINAKVTIDASGFSSVVAKKVGLHEGFKRFGVGAEYDLYAPKYDQDESILIVGSRVAPSGYGWIFPHGNNRVRVGVGLIHPVSVENPKKYLNKLINEIPGVSENLTNSAQIEYHYGIVPSEGLVKKTVSNGLIVVGDAAGQLNALIGEGIRYAIKFGRLAGVIAADSVLNKNYSENFLEKYQKSWSDYRKKVEITYDINKRIAQYSDEKWDRRVEMLSKLTPSQFVDFIKGDFSLSWAMGVLLRNPSFIGSTTFSLVKKKFEKKNS